MSTDIIHLDIGNSIFRTTRSTLVNVDGFFARMLSEDKWAESGTKENPIFVDRDPTTFPSILSYLRSRKVIITSSEDNTYLQKLLIEADFYMLSDLSYAITEEVNRRVANSNQIKEDYIYRAVPTAHLNAYFERGWVFVGKYRDDAVSACADTGIKLPASWVNYQCTACHESMSSEKFHKHVTLYERTMIVLKKHHSLGSSNTKDGTNLGDLDVLAFDQSFG